MNQIKTKTKIGIIHIGEREKSGLQIVEKLKQFDYEVVQWDFHLLEQKKINVKGLDTIVVNIADSECDYYDLIDDLIEKDIKLIFNEAKLTNALSGVKRQSWERHLLNKIDAKFSVTPVNTELNYKNSDALDLTQFGKNKVWILAASIGGPESIKEFITEFKGDENQLFIIIQHMNKEFLNGLALQLNKNIALNTEIPISGMKIVDRTCLLHPTDEFLHFEKSGNIVLEALPHKYKFSPCIDELTKKLSGNIEKLNIAVFSGMSTDGIEAAKVIKDNGNLVITQTESSCVLSTIIAGIKKQINVDFEGTPKEMAAYIKKYN